MKNKTINLRLNLATNIKRRVDYYFFGRSPAHGVQDQISNKDYTQSELFGSASTGIIQLVDHSRFISIKNQKYTNSCSAHGAATMLEVKLGLLLRMKCTVNAFTLWNGMLIADMASEKNGAFLKAPLDYLRIASVPFKTADGRSGKVKVEFYYSVEKTFVAVNREINEAGAVITGYASFKGLSVASARYRPYVIKDTNEHKFNGHLMAISGSQKVEKELSCVNPNSYGIYWGDRGYCYTEGRDLNKCFTLYGASISYVMDEEPNKTLFETMDERLKRIMEWKKSNKGKTISQRKKITK